LSSNESTLTANNVPHSAVNINNEEGMSGQWGTTCRNNLSASY